MSEQYLRTRQRKGLKWFWCALAGVAVIAGVGITAGVLADRGEELTAEQVLDRIEEARAALGPVSYRMVSNSQSYDPAPGLADHHHRTVEVLDAGAVRRSSSDVLLVFEDGEDREYRELAVRNDRAFGTRYNDTSSDVWHVDSVEAMGSRDPGRARLQSATQDYLRYGFGIGVRDLTVHRDRERRKREVRTVEREGRTLIDVYPSPGDDGRPFGTHVRVDPERGYLVTRVRVHVDGVVTREHNVEPVLVEGDAGEEVWFPGSVEIERWIPGSDGDRELRSHRIIRFEDVRLNVSIADDDFSLPVALEWEDGHPVRVHDEERPREIASYRDGDLTNVAPIFPHDE